MPRWRGASGRVGREVVLVLVVAAAWCVRSGRSCLLWSGVSLLGRRSATGRVGRRGVRLARSAGDGATRRRGTTVAERPASPAAAASRQTTVTSRKQRGRAVLAACRSTPLYYLLPATNHTAGTAGPRNCKKNRTPPRGACGSAASRRLTAAARGAHGGGCCASTKSRCAVTVPRRYDSAKTATRTHAHVDGPCFAVATSCYLIWSVMTCDGNVF